MKRFLLLFSLLFIFVLMSQAQTDYLQFEVMGLTPKMGQGDMLKKGLAAHHKAYHASDPYRVGVFEVITGPNSGDYDWVMGPTTWTQMDSRPAGDAHDADWNKNVVPYLEHIGETSYWRIDNDRGYQPENAGQMSKSRFRFTTLLPDGRERYEEQLDKVIAVYKAKKYGGAFTVYWRYGADDGPHVATQLSFANWAYLDNGSDFTKDFEEVHGAGSWARFQDELNLCVDRTKTYDELMEFQPDMSSPTK